VAETTSDPTCPFCSKDLRAKAVARAEFCFAIPHPHSPVTGHLLVVSFRHARDFLALTADERRDCEDLLRVLGNESRSADGAIKGFSVLAGASREGCAGASHALVHLIPDRNGGELNAVVGAGARLR
jgi:diadenosine tetraphosphate (Ap4A) HIT family hydrolase